MAQDLLDLLRGFQIGTERMAGPKQRANYVTAVDGSPLLLSDLPGPNHKRWVVRHKANLVAAVRGGLISLEDACNRYKLSADEFLSWQQTFERFGLKGLRVTRVQQYRSSVKGAS